MNTSSKQAGFSLVEMMVGIVVGLVIFAGVSGLFVNTLMANSTKISVQRADQTLRSLTDYMGAELKRSSFTSPGQTLHIAFSPSAGTANSCVSFSRSNATASLDAVGNVTFGPADEVYFGFALANNAIYMAKVTQPFANSTIPVSCATFSSTAPNWSMATDPGAFRITGFNVDASGFPLINVRIAGEVVGQRSGSAAALVRVAQFSTKIRNN